MNRHALRHTFESLAVALVLIAFALGGVLALHLLVPWSFEPPRVG